MTDTELVRAITESSLSKIQGANGHIDSIRQRSSPLDPSLYRIFNREVRGPFVYINPPTFYEIAYRPEKDIPKEFADIIGDVLGDLRSALDYLAHRIVRKWTNIDPKKPPIYFPLAPRKDLPAHGSFLAIEQALPGFKKLLLDEIRPKNGPNDRFWDFSTMRNDAEHDDYVPTVTVVEVDGINLVSGGLIVRNHTHSFDAARPHRIISSANPITIKNDLKIAVEVKFGKGTPFKREPVVPTLTQISQVVAETIKSVGCLIASTKS